MKKRIRAVSGGTGASKTISILIWCIDYAQSSKNKVISIVSESYPHLEKGTIRDFQNIMQDRGYWNDKNWNGTQHTYAFETGSIIEFLSVDKLGKAHGPRRDILFINECNWLAWDIADQLITRTREVIWLDWNPVTEFWYYTELQNKRDDIEFLKLTYLDNEGLGESERKEIESRRNNPRWWRVYGLGELGEAEGRIYTGWQEIDEIPHEARLERYGLDFGYHPDPAAIVAIYYWNGSYILDEVLYGLELRNSDLAATLKNLPRALVIADSAEPKSIDELKLYGINIIGTEKGRDSKRYGIKAVQALRISITKRSVNLLKEYRNYYQLIDRRTNTSVIGETDGKDDLLDASRYGLCSLIPVKTKQELRAQLYQNYPRQPKHNIAL